jgi:crossover junction endodeoxyribonuclease RuvC
MKAVAGIDPGLKGAVAWITEDGGFEIYPTPVMKVGSKNFYWVANMSLAFYKYLNDGYDITVYLEKAQAMPKQGVSSTFKTGEGFGLWQGILSAMNIPYVVVTPQKWQKRILAGMKGSTKDRSAVAATRLFPDESFVAEGCRKIHDGMTDAACIARYGWLEEMGGNENI